MAGGKQADSKFQVGDKADDSWFVIHVIKEMGKNREQLQVFACNPLNRVQVLACMQFNRRFGAPAI